jgi:hypothetical protein
MYVVYSYALLFFLLYFHINDSQLMCNPHAVQRLKFNYFIIFSLTQWCQYCRSHTIDFFRIPALTGKLLETEDTCNIPVRLQKIVQFWHMSIWKCPLEHFKHFETTYLFWIVNWLQHIVDIKSVKRIKGGWKRNLHHCLLYVLHYICIAQCSGKQ